MKLIVGLGNPGRKYSHSRHNVGFRCVDHMAREWGVRLAERRAKVVLGRGQVSDQPVVLAKCRTFMNQSGEGVAYLLSRFSATPGDLVIIYDDMDLPLGNIRIRTKGSAAGHNGIKSLISNLHTVEFARIRVGIGRPPEEVDGVDYVLGSFLPDESPLIEGAVAMVAGAAACMLTNGIGEAMNSFNRARELGIEGVSRGNGGDKDC